MSYEKRTLKTRLQTNINCICGDKLDLTLCISCYGDEIRNNRILCDICFEKINWNDFIHHCSSKSKNSLEIHPNGHDYCLNCVKKHHKSKFIDPKSMIVTTVMYIYCNFHDYMYRSIFNLE